MSKEQFQVSYGLLKKHLRDIDETKASYQLDLASNNIKWHLGHIMLINDYFVFETVDGEKALEQKNGKYFRPGTSPKDFDGNEPTFNELKSALDQQLNKIENELQKQLTKEREEPFILKEPHVVMDDFNKTSQFAITHTNNHIGHIKLLSTMINKLFKISNN